MLKNTLLLGSAIMLVACGGDEPEPTMDAPTEVAVTEEAPAAEMTATDEAAEMDDSDKYVVQPLVTEIYTADPSVHVWDDGRIYVYPSHDYEAGIPQDDLGSHFDMRDYIVLSMDEVGGDVTIHPVALDKDDVPWVGRQMWAPDAAYKDGTYYLYFPAKDKQDIFRIGVATSDSPVGPFTPQAEPIEGSYSIDPAVFQDDDGEYYMYLGGIWGGQLQRWTTGEYIDGPELNMDLGDDSAPALLPKIAKMSDDMLSFDEELKDVQILDQEGNPILTGDHDRRFFEAAWVFKKDGVYYMTYSTGDTHYLVYATGDNPYGPFTYQGKILEPVEGWTSHHSVFQHDGQWYLAYHDVQLSGQTHLRNAKIMPMTFNEDGSIQTMSAMK
ncbi:glycoside hydrolase family 43 protein [Parvularcula sp. LCG005]|uniref:glycoside hydrolase family 43 protein n=1 Tax=Parvularcula sp. LCG005 TaxID=3078805 RepID=UPI002942C85B|nr:glycoside hydrolase family 43 protein [Parvularcula sp. LCG005]WOI52653.1 glycoside hydrolase family 43 protein [Parvularcula sp. LCG005]